MLNRYNVLHEQLLNASYTKNLKLARLSETTWNRKDNTEGI